ncbi:hypothetical protein HZ326_21239 [Fusarium oxysporum f. sp. albedinis]|nr:hypothetical protein HZ326_21239 [Fusarium oxysporum f. sp. albedinis]
MTYAQYFLPSIIDINFAHIFYKAAILTIYTPKPDQHRVSDAPSNAKTPSNQACVSKVSFLSVSSSVVERPRC